MDPTRTIPTVLRAGSSTLQQLGDAAIAPQLELLRAAA